MTQRQEHCFDRGIAEIRIRVRTRYLLQSRIRLSSFDLSMSPFLDPGEGILFKRTHARLFIGGDRHPQMTGAVEVVSLNVVTKNPRVSPRMRSLQRWQSGTRPRTRADGYWPTHQRRPVCCVRHRSKTPCAKTGTADAASKGVTPWRKERWRLLGSH